MAITIFKTRLWLALMLLIVAALAVGLALTVNGTPLRATGPTRAPVAAPRAGAEILDYLIQDVCVDAAQRIVKGDPARCATHRNLRIGERLPYMVTDYDRKLAISLSSMSSIPVRGVDGNLMVLVTKSLHARYGADFRFSYSRELVAFDLIDLSHSRYASIVRTFDSGCFDQLMSSKGGSGRMADRAGGWILVPLYPPPSQWDRSGSLRLTTFRRQLAAAGPQCASNSSAGITNWTGPTNYTFETGKTLRALRSDHFAAADLSQPENSFERFYLTREYGTARWESWWTLAYCHKTLGRQSPRCGQSPLNALTSRCSVLKLPGNEVSGLERWGGQAWVRMDCRDSTRYLALNSPLLPLTPEIASGNGLVDIDYRGTVGASQAP